MSVYAFSTANFKRGRGELDGLMGLAREKMRVLADKRFVICV